VLGPTRAPLKLRKEEFTMRHRGHREEYNFINSEKELFGYPLFPTYHHDG
jgi:hypothetical protein